MVTEQPYYEVDPWFWNEMDQRRDEGSNVVALVIGPNNWGKSWWSLRLAEEMHSKWKLSKFTVQGVVFNASQFWNYMQNSEPDSWCVWDEPNKGLSHREWWEEVNKAVTTFIQTMRFKRKNLLLALPHDKLIDKSARAVLLFRAKMLRPGLATIEQILPDYYGNKEYFTFGRGEVDLYAPSRKLLNEYNLKKDEFHKSDFPEEAFQEPSKQPELHGWRKIYEIVKADPDKFRVQDPRNPHDPGRLSARKISALCDCSDNTARKVVTKLEYEYIPHGLPAKPAS